MAALKPNEQIAEWAQRVARLGSCGKMCGSCAFRKGSEANKEPWNVEKALQAIAWEGTFNCHPQSSGEGDAGYPCAGFLYAKKYLADKFKTAVNE